MVRWVWLAVAGEVVAVVVVVSLVGLLVLLLLLLLQRYNFVFI